jgi:amino acid adenylation domain-containing protein
MDETRLAALSPAKRRLLALRQEQERERERRNRSIPKASPGAPLPLSFAEERMWMLARLGRGRLGIHHGGGIRFAGTLDAGALRRALAELVRRQETLRTTFPAPAGEPVPVVLAATEFATPLIDLGGLADADRERERLVTAFGERPFDLAREMPFRAALLRLPRPEHVLVLGVSHIAIDGASVAVLSRELSALYEAFAAGRPSPLPELPIQYRDFAFWQRRELASEAARAALDREAERLSTAPAELDLPADRPRPAGARAGGAGPARAGRRPFALAPDLSRALRARAAERGATPFMFLLAAFATLLSRLSGQVDLTVGAPIAGRDRTELRDLIGLLANTLVLRLALAGDPPFDELLARVRQTALAAFAQADLPFELLHERLSRERGRSELFRVLLNLVAAPAEGAVRFLDLTFDAVAVERAAVYVDLFAIVTEREGRFSGAVLYDAEHFDRATVSRLVGQFETLLGSAVAAPERPLAALALLGPAERHQVAVEWNDTAALGATRGGTIAGGAGGASVVDRLAELAAREPEAVAVVAGGGNALSHAELDARADRLARHLRHRGLGTGDRVAICLERSLDLVVAVVGVLRAGAAYVPLDPGHPRERLAFLLADAGVRLLLTRPGLAALPPGGPPELALALALSPPQPGSGAVPPGRRPEAGDPAYVLYTSGSTGTPKGVVVQHGNLADYVGSLGDRLGIGPGDVYLHTASFAFSSSIRQLFLPLCRGARVALATVDELRDPLALCRRIREERVTIADLVPSHWQSVTGALGRCAPAARAELLDNSLRLTLAASEPLPAAVPRRWAELGHGARWIHMLGHTETCGIDAVFPLLPPPLPPGEADGPLVPLGRPFANRRLYVLDAAWRPVPIGVTGEIAIAGAGVGEGYLGQPERTAAAFVPDPWGAPGVRLYLTGDLGRLRADGIVEFAGRRDHQVKIRGHRIEVAEIEDRLGRQPGVARAVVAARPPVAGETGDAMLVAYVVPGEGAPPAAAELSRALAEHLPGPMLPAAFVFLDALPLTPTGKLDRAALPAPGAVAATLDGADAPRTRIETEMARLWAEVLHRPQVGLHDSFSDLGGHSLLAVLLQARIQAAFGVEISLRAFFDRPTVARLVEEVERRLIEAAPEDDLAAVLEELHGPFS